MTHHHYAFDRVFSAEDGNEEVYAAVRPLVHWACKGMGATLICYGQTGTGKTHTMVGALERAVKELEGLDVEVVFFEIHGRCCYDLLRERASVRLLADADDNVCVRGARQVRLKSATSTQLMGILTGALGMRRVQVTERNPISSRSHAVCELRISRGQNLHPCGRGAVSGDSTSLPRMDLLSLDATNAAEEQVVENCAGQPGSVVSGEPGLNQKASSVGETCVPSNLETEADDSFLCCGVLRLVDLAGSERNYETTQMTAGQHRDSAEINKALMALKDCFRANAKGVRAPYRNSRLTQVLKACFTVPTHQTVVVATVSPAPTDLTHTVNTLEHVSFMAAPLGKLSKTVTVELPLANVGAINKPIQKWTNEEVVAFVATTAGGRFAHVALPAGLDGQGLMRLSTKRLAQLFEGTMRVARVGNEGHAWNETLDNQEGAAANPAADAIGRALFAALRQESRRIALAEGQRRWAAEQTPQHQAGNDDAREHGIHLQNGEQLEGETQETTRAHAINTAARVHTLGGPQVLWWLDNNSSEGADEAAAEATTLLQHETPNAV
mmetsp:Transcript_48222/g.89807  ORF Transcript_48222/g.89807 Transcript_48222/m.89807 type:complete len:555 (-) Transcript_48222:761-2425(-)